MNVAISSTHFFLFRNPGPKESVCEREKNSSTVRPVKIGNIVKHSDAKLEQSKQVTCNKNDTHYTHKMSSCVNVSLFLSLSCSSTPWCSTLLFQFEFQFYWVYSVWLFLCALKICSAHWKLNAPSIEQHNMLAVQKKQCNTIQKKQWRFMIMSSLAVCTMHMQQK